MGKKTHRIGITLLDQEKIHYDDHTGEATNLQELASDSEVVYFDITPVTPAIEEQAAAITSTVVPPPIYEDHPARPTGTVRKLVGYNDQDPKYLSELDTAERKREIFICLSCCAALNDSTPGDTVQEKLHNAMEKIPRAVISGLFNAISNIGALQQDAGFFLSNASKDSPSSESSGT